MTDFAENILLYLPVGIALGIENPAVARSCLIALFCSLTLELFQIAVPGRDSSASDLAANTLGAWMGAALWGKQSARIGPAITGVLSVIQNPTTGLSSVLSLAWALVVATVVMVTALLLRPVLPDGDWIVPGPDLDQVDGPLRIGGNGREDGFFAGTIDEVGVFMSARSGASIRNDMLRPLAESLPQTDLVAAYTFNEPSHLVARDVREQAPEARLNGAIWSDAGKFGGGLVFNGRSAEAVVPGAPELARRTAVTVEAWVRPSGESARWPAIVTQAQDAYYLRASARGQRFVPVAGGRFGGADEEVRAAMPIGIGAWSHLAMTYDGQVTRLFVNGREAASVRRWSPHRPHFIAIGGHQLSFGAVSDSARLSQALAKQLDVAVDVLCGARGSGPVLRISSADPPYRDLLRLEAVGRDLAIRFHSLARGFGLSVLDQVVPGGLSCNSGDVLKLRLGRAIPDPRVELNGEIVEVPRFGVASGWAFLVYAPQLAPSIRQVLGFAWVAALLVPFGYLARLRIATVVGGLVMVAAFLAAPLLCQVRGLGAPGVAAVLVGGILGAIGRSKRAQGRGD